MVDVFHLGWSIRMKRGMNSFRQMTKMHTLHSKSSAFLIRFSIAGMYTKRRERSFTNENYFLTNKPCVNMNLQFFSVAAQTVMMNFAKRCSHSQDRIEACLWFCDSNHLQSKPFIFGLKCLRIYLYIWGDYKQRIVFSASSLTSMQNELLQLLQHFVFIRKKSE